MASHKNLAGYRILILEDELYVGFDLRAELLDCGAEVIGPIADLDMAFDIVDTKSSIDAAVLDVNLRGELVFPLADLLVQQDIPFIFTTGYGVDVIPYRLRSIVRQEKPARTSDIARAVASLVPHVGMSATRA